MASGTILNFGKTSAKHRQTTVTEEEQQSKG